jgi:hypothetical protein
MTNFVIFSSVFFTSCDTGNNGTSSIDPPANRRAQTEASGVTLYWSDVPEATTYEIYCGLSEDNLEYFVNQNKIMPENTTQNNISYTVSASSPNLTGGNMYYFAIKSSGSVGAREFSNIVNAFLPPGGRDSISHVNSVDVPLASTSALNHKRITEGGTQWYYISATMGTTYTIHVSNDKASASTNAVANVNKNFFMQDGVEFSGTIVPDKNQYLYIKITAISSGEYRIYYTTN